jgi:hypothetical protein
MQQEGSKTDVELTPEMIAAGVAAYMEWSHEEDQPAVIVADVFCQMLAASHELRLLNV